MSAADLVVGFVCEGPTDTPILMAVVDAVLGNYVPRFLQPEHDKLTGWAGGGDTRVEAWCKGHGPVLKWLLLDVDLLIVQMDGDRAAKYAAANLDELCERIKGWLGAGQTSEKLVITIPAQASEAWLVAAHLSVTPALETERHPEARLANAKLVDRNERGEAVKDRARYEDLAVRLRDELAETRRVLPELDRFVRKLERQYARLRREPVDDAG